MYKVEITTNRHWRAFKRDHEVPREVINWYDWLTRDQKFDGWICYKGHWSHVSDYMRFGSVWLSKPPESFEDWQGVKHDCMSSGTLINLADDGEEYQIGWYVSVSNNGGE